jgi:hypothetical protein
MRGFAAWRTWGPAGLTWRERELTLMRIRFTTLLLLVAPFLLLVAAAYIQWDVVGLPALPPIPSLTPATAPQPHGFPAWGRITHYVNFPDSAHPQRPANTYGSSPALVDLQGRRRL